MQNQAVNFFTGHQEAGGAFWQQARVVGGQNWQVNKLLAVLQGGIGQSSFNCGTCLAVIVLRFTGATICWELVVALATATGVQLDALQAKYVHTKAYGALGEAGLVDGFQT